MAKTEAEIHRACVNRFIDLANEIKNNGTDANIVSAGLMTASALYTSFLAGGNEGGLTDSGVEKAAAAYKVDLQRIQKIKKDGNAA